MPSLPYPSASLKVSASSVASEAALALSVAALPLRRGEAVPGSEDDTEKSLG